MQFTAASISRSAALMRTEAWLTIHLDVAAKGSPEKPHVLMAAFNMLMHSRHSALGAKTDGHRSFWKANIPAHHMRLLNVINTDKSGSIIPASIISNK